MVEARKFNKPDGEYTELTINVTMRLGASFSGDAAIYAVAWELGQ